MSLSLYREKILFTAGTGPAGYDIWAYVPLTRRIIRLTRGLAEAFSVPYPSRDGRRLAFIGRNSILYALDLRSGSLAQLDRIEPYTLLDWSPDSGYLSYVKEGRIVIYHLDSHRHTVIATVGATDAGWFPSGTSLLYAAPDPIGNVQLYQINLNGTNVRQLTRNEEGPLHDVRLSPDGRFALYTSPGASISLISVVNLATGQTTRLEGGPEAKNYNPAWSPDSSRIAYSATSLIQNQYISYIQTDRREGGQIATWAVSSCFSTPVSWSPDGRRIAYLSGCEGQESAKELWIADTDALRSPAKVLEAGSLTAIAWIKQTP
ncbi:hypothetical protein J25TS5_21250 [Paenibacillus faecis]|uniref:TolB family protein n=1 Tax=Paenibacillus faecis TaxID=862114 RepID=UPI001B1A9984|nr:PD40 domain-containing protein [Paenibacillus faecis]GIO85193.1 hypothetical protein J25TS5_21250 [Paenibacillus faecis]